jgi:predicted acylesterase/phospholipase RssA
MDLDHSPALSRENSVAQQHKSTLGEFASGLGSHLRAPFAGLADTVTGQVIVSRTAEPAAPETKSRLAGEMAGDAIVFLGTTALLKRIPGVGALAPVAAGGVLGMIEPLKQGDGLEQRLVHASVGAGTMLMLEKGPAALARVGIVSSAEKSVAGALASGAIIGAATEQANVLSHTGHLASLGETATGALSFGLTSGAVKGLGNYLDIRAQAFGERSRAADAGSILPSLQDIKGILGHDTSESSANQGWHIVLGSGGSKAALTGAGVVLATRAARLKIESIGGVSGGFVPAALAATDMPSHQFLEVARKTDIASLLTQRPLFRQVVKEGRKLDLLKDGLYDTSPLGDMVHGHMPSAKWPEKLWTMAVGDEHSQVVFTKNGVTEYGPSGQVILSGKPPKVGDAVRATSAIPGVLASMELYGRRLYDGALGQFGKCPSDMAKMHFGIPEERVIASLPVGAMTYPNKKLYQFAKYLSGNTEKGSENFVEHAGIVVRPEVKSFHSLRFALRPAQRDEAILAGYRSAIEQFATNNLISGDRLIQARTAGQSIAALEAYFAPKPVFPFFNPDILRLTGPKTNPTPKA